MTYTKTLHKEKRLLKFQKHMKYSDKYFLNTNG